MGCKIIYQSKDECCDLYDLEIWLDEGVYGLSIESAIEYRNIDGLRDYYLNLLNGCKEYFEQQYKLESKNGYLKVECELYYNEKFELFSIWFKPMEFLRLEELYLWVCEAIKKVNCIK